MWDLPFRVAHFAHCALKVVGMSRVPSHSSLHRAPLGSPGPLPVFQHYYYPRYRDHRCWRLLSNEAEVQLRAAAKESAYHSALLFHSMFVVHDNILLNIIHVVGPCTPPELVSGYFYHT
jgi:hypothetical protein